MVRCAPETCNAFPVIENQPGEHRPGTARASADLMSFGTRPPVLILGKHITALGVLRTLAHRGIETYVIESTDDVITRSRWYRRPAMTLAETSDASELSDYLRALEIPSAVLIACGDRWTQAVAALPADVRERFPASMGSRDLVDLFIDKERFRTLVERLGIPAPRAAPVASPDDLERAAAGFPRPAFLKPTDSQLYARRYGTKGWFLEDMAAARAHVSEAVAAGTTFMLQDWIPGGPNHSIILDGFVDRHGRLRGIVARRRLRMDPPRLSNTAASVTIPLAEVAPAVADMRRLTEAVGYRGIFNVEFKFDDRDGTFRIIEVNARPFWMIAHVAKIGLDLPWMTYLDALQLPVPAMERYRLGRFAHYEVPDAASIVRALLHGRRPDGPVLRTWLTGDHSMFWWSDPVPGLLDYRNALVRRGHDVARRLRREPVSAT
jgi:D-aspartate ligase